MGASIGFSGVGGIGLQAKASEPDITVVTFMGRSKVYVRRTSKWKEAIAEFVNESHADFFATALKLNSD
jgi:hypothetical protein